MPNDLGQTQWADVKATIAKRLVRPNLDPTFIQFIAEECADLLAADGFFPSEQTNTTLSTQPGQYFYTLPRGIVDILHIRFLITNVWLQIYRAHSYEEILVGDPVQPPFTALPSLGRVFGRLLRLFPTPNGIYPLELTVVARVDVPADDTDTDSFWVNEGRTLMVNRVCEKISAELFRNPDRAALHKRAGDEARDALDEITHSRSGSQTVQRYL